MSGFERDPLDEAVHQRHPDIRQEGLVDVPPLPTGWWEWTSPNGVVHAVPPNRPCATCGKAHVEPEVALW